MWEVLSCKVSSRGIVDVEGINHANTNPLDRKFFWTLSKESLMDPRFDYSGCSFGEGALDRIMKALEIQIPI